MSYVSPRETFDRQLRELQDDVLMLGSMVVQAVLESVDSLKRRDLESARRIYISDKAVNEKRYHIESDCLRLIATQQPMARDLRTLAAVLEINTELERIGDYAKGIAKINLMLGDEPLIKPLVDIPLMAEMGANMLNKALEAFVNRDVEAARAIPLMDNAVDDLYNKVYRDLLELMLKDTSTIDHANFLLWAAHNLERLADRVTNICERIIFVVTGEMGELDSTDDELITGRKSDTP